ncbi:hypothetical protein CSOJ01_06331 [Colletotrichum sojae]|uniref:Uncharacterized protein n=1 Tax=Colletotrichum sojae TaxID=2175907 RepID=A0A8H6JD60_9PEZI|nr:hypothetical protein CSOJ01_06331 [Colletotrichum sojae]
MAEQGIVSSCAVNQPATSRRETRGTAGEDLLPSPLAEHRPDDAGPVRHIPVAGGGMRLREHGNQVRYAWWCIAEGLAEPSGSLPRDSRASLSLDLQGTLRRSKQL